VTAKLSVVLCTYNGAAYLPCLLDSLVNQRRPPDELVVSDDGSTDGTPALIASFAKSAPFPVRWFEHETRLGPAANFAAAAQHARGDWIAFCDQDDVWHRDKLDRALSAAQKCADASAVFCNARLIDSTGHPLGRELWQHVAFTPREQQAMAAGKAWDVLVRHPVVSGAGLLIHARVRDHLAPISDDWLHDSWAALIAAGCGRVIAIAAPLFDYRQHDGNVIGARPRTLTDFWKTARTLDRTAFLAAECRRWEALATRLASLPESQFKQATAEAVTSKLAHLMRRRDLPPARMERLNAVSREWRSGAYRRYTKGWQPLLADLLL
jgi:glycosyltransferase involved in cell wall biosynthesis